MVGGDWIVVVLGRGVVVMGDDLSFAYDNFPCTEPLRDGMEKRVAQLLYETAGSVPMGELEKICPTRNTIYVVVSGLRSKLQEGYRIMKSGDGYRLFYPDQNGEYGVVQESIGLLRNQVNSYRCRIEEINKQLQVLNENKQTLKQKLEIAEVGLLALNELAVGDDVS